MSCHRRIVTRILAASAVHRAFYTANTGPRTMSFDDGAGPGVWVAVRAADRRLRWPSESFPPLQSLRLLAKNSQRETRRSNEGTRVKARRANDSGLHRLSGLRWGQYGRTLVSELAQK
jgi:hypothetical protein